MLDTAQVARVSYVVPYDTPSQMAGPRSRDESLAVCPSVDRQIMLGVTDRMRMQMLVQLD